MMDVLTKLACYSDLSVWLKGCVDNVRALTQFGFSSSTVYVVHVGNLGGVHVSWANRCSWTVEMTILQLA